MSFYDDMKVTANDLLAEFGQTIVITTQTAGTYSPTTGTSTVTTATQTGRGAIFEYTNGSRDIDGTLIQQGDKKLLLSAVGITAPQMNDTLVANGKTWTIKGIKETNPAGSIVMYECNLRGV